MKNLIRSIFIGIFPLIALIGLVFNIISLITSETISIQNIGSGLTSLAVVLFFFGLFIKPQARTSKNLNLYTIIAILGLITSIVSYFNEREQIIALVISALITAGWIMYIFWYSIFKDRDTSILKVGNKLPEFNLENDHKESINSKTFIKKPSIWLFYRGNWCPLCMAQIKEVVNEYHELEKRGVNTILVSPQPHKFSKELAEKFKVSFNFLTDAKNVAAKQLGIFIPNGIPAGFQALGYDSDTVMPTVIITDTSGKIVYADLTDNYRIRPEPKTFLKIIDTL